MLEICIYIYEWKWHYLSFPEIFLPVIFQGYSSVIQLCAEGCVISTFIFWKTIIDSYHLLLKCLVEFVGNHMGLLLSFLEGY